MAVKPPCFLGQCSTSQEMNQHADSPLHAVVFLQTEKLLSRQKRYLVIFVLHHEVLVSYCCCQIVENEVML